MAKKKQIFLKSKKKNGIEKNKGRTREKQIIHEIINDQESAKVESKTE